MKTKPMKSMNKRSLFTLLGLLVICLVGGSISGLSTLSEIEGWYLALNKPSWTPPNWVFGPVWTTLYTLIAIACWLVWREAGTFRAMGWGLVSGAAGAFFVQLALNFIWSPVFFGLHAPWTALVIIVALAVWIVFTIRAFWYWSRLGALLMVPYLAWVCLATSLTAGVAVLN